MTKLERLPAWSLSLGLHALLIFFGFSLFFQSRFKSRVVNFEVIVNPKLAPSSLNLQTVKPQVKPEVEPAQRQVFGASRKAITATEAAPDAATIKQGNTVAKAEDDLKLNANDADSLPIPTDDYLVSAMPTLLSEVRIPYPEEARRASVDGPVVMDLLIDQEGKVRQVTLVKGPGFGLNEAALNAILLFKFQPAKVEDRAVAVRIRYTYRFVLQSR